MPKMNDDLRALLLATNLGRSRDHPLAGWNILNILYGNNSSSNVPQTLGFIVDQYNARYLNVKFDESQITDAVLNNVLKVLTDEARFVEKTTRKMRILMVSGAYHMQQASVYRITSRGIEYLTMIPKVLDAESTVTANISRIDEYCALVAKLNQPMLDVSNTKLFNDFHNMLSAYFDVMKGMHRLGEDLDEVSNNLSFDHGSNVAEYLNQMLNLKALPAYVKLLSQASQIQRLAKDKTFADKIARSRQGSDSLDIGQAINDQVKLTIQSQKDRNYVRNQMDNLSSSFEPTTTAIDNNYDSIYLIFQTIRHAIMLLSREYDHVNRQTVDIQQLNNKIDYLLQHYQSVSIPKKMPRHLAQDRIVADPNDLIEASTLGPILYQANKAPKKVATVEDNPVISEDEPVQEERQQALKEFQNLVMKNSFEGQVDHDLELTTLMARDEIMRLYSATGYDHYESFAPFGRPIQEVKALSNKKPIWLHCRQENYSVQLPSGFYFQFQKNEAI